MMEGKVTITKEQYYYLKCAEAKLDLLEAGGVEEWDWYEEALYPDCEPNIEDREEELIFKVERM